MTKIHTLEIVSHVTPADGYRRLTLAGGIGALPGQFVQIGVSETLDPLLRRPISVHDCSEDTLTLLYRIAGRGTALLAQKQAGQSLSLIGPLGNGFSCGASPEAVVVAGGIGAAPLYYLLKMLRQRGKRVHFFYGGRTAAELLLREEFRELADHYYETTDDGSAGSHGFVTKQAAAAVAGLDADVYACGPSPMLREMARLAANNNKLCYVSLEAHMACGVGACLGCVIPVRGGEKYKRVCVDGPVFAAEEVFFS